MMFRLRTHNPEASFDKLGIHRRRDRQGGFTLIEALLVIALLAVGLTAVFYLMAVGTDMNINTRDQMVAYQAANEYMDFLRQKPYTTLTNTSGTFGATSTDVGYQALTQLTNPLGSYTIADYPGSGADAVKQITVTVQWSRKSASRNVSVSVSTLSAKGGLNERWNTN